MKVLNSVQGNVFYVYVCLMECLTASGVYLNINDRKSKPEAYSDFQMTVEKLIQRYATTSNNHKRSKQLDVSEFPAITRKLLKYRAYKVRLVLLLVG